MMDTVEQCMCRLKVYRDNDDKTAHYTMFEVEFDPTKEDKNGYQIAKGENNTVTLEVDVFKPVARHIKYLEGEVSRLERRVDSLEEALEDCDCDPVGDGL